MALRISGKSDNQLTDTELLSGYLSSGDLGILGSLYERYMHLVYGVCLKYLKNRDDSQDAVMAIFEKLITEVQRHSVENFKSWLYVLTKNYCLMHLRSAGSQSEKLKKMKSDTTSFMENSSDMHPIDKDEAVSDSDLEECIEKLKDEQLKCIRLFYYESRCYREIADLLNLDEKKVKSHLQNAKRNLRICLESNDE